MPRCFHCNYRKSFTIKCKFDNEYCSKHLLPEIHNCLQLGEYRKEAFDINKKSLESTVKKKVEWITTTE